MNSNKCVCVNTCELSSLGIVHQFRLYCLNFVSRSFHQFEPTFKYLPSPLRFISSAVRSLFFAFEPLGTRINFGSVAAVVTRVALCFGEITRRLGVFVWPFA